MLQHFQFQPLFKSKQIPGWKFSFYFSGKKFEGIYHQDGKIKWTADIPESEHENSLQKQIHDLMLFHVYDQER